MNEFQPTCAVNIRSHYQYEKNEKNGLSGPSIPGELFTYELFLRFSLALFDKNNYSKTNNRHL